MKTKTDDRLPEHKPLAPAELAESLLRLAEDNVDWPRRVLLGCAQTPVLAGSSGLITPHPFLVLVTTGTITTATGDAVAAGEAVWFPPQTFADFQRGSDTTICRITWEPGQIVAGRRGMRGEEMAPLELCVARQPAEDRCGALLTHLRRVADRPAELRRVVALLACETARTLRAAAAGGLTRPDAYTTFTACRAFARENAHRLIGREETARAVGISKAHLSRLYQRFSPVSFQEQLRRDRLEQARALLRQTPLPVADIAARCGFRSASYFVRIFREHHGIPPHQWRLRQNT